MQTTQAGILAEETRLARHLLFTSLADTDPRDALQALAGQLDGETAVLGLGHSLLQSLDADIPGMRNFPAMTGKAVEVPSTPMSLWCWLRGDDRGVLLHRGRDISRILSPAFELAAVIDSFQYGGNHDLSGYEDGTENPKGDEAIDAAIVQNQGAGLDGSSFVAVQQWLHDLDYMDSLTQIERDDIIGRRLSDNEEFDAAPESAWRQLEQYLIETNQADLLTQIRFAGWEPMRFENDSFDLKLRSFFKYCICAPGPVHSPVQSIGFMVN